MRITALAGGVGGARFLRGLLAHIDRTPTLADSSLTVIGNTGDDINLFGLRVCPDLDTVMYTLGGGVNEEQGWGRAEETHAVQDELAAYGAQPQWFGLGDRDFGTHIARSQWLGQGLSLSEVTARLSARWGLAEQGVTLLPMTDSPVETHVVVDDVSDSEVADSSEEPALRQKAVHFQEWWVRMNAAVPAHRFVAVGMLLLLNCHWYVMGVTPETAAENVTGSGVQMVWLTGLVRICNGAFVSPTTSRMTFVGL